MKKNKGIERRTMLKVSASAGVGLLLGSCRRQNLCEKCGAEILPVSHDTQNKVNMKKCRIEVIKVMCNEDIAIEYGKKASLTAAFIMWDRCFTATEQDQKDCAVMLGYALNSM
jgi:ribosomal protein S5